MMYLKFIFLTIKVLDQFIDYLTDFL